MTPQDIDITLPGWGSWAGVGTKDKPQKKVRKIDNLGFSSLQNSGNILLILGLTKIGLYWKTGGERGRALKKSPC